MNEKGMVERQQREKNPLRRRWKLVVALMILFVVIVVLVVDLALKPEPGVIENNWVFLQEMHRSNSSSSVRASNSSSLTSSSPSSSVEFKLRLVFLVTNPNIGGKFRYSDAGVLLYNFKREIVGQSSIEAGEIPSQDSKNLSVVVQANSSSDDGVAEYSSQTNITAFVSKWGIFRHHYKLGSTCDVKLSIINNSLITYSCDH